MNDKDKKCFDEYYQQLFKCIKLQGKADSTIDSCGIALSGKIESWIITHTLHKNNPR